MFKLYMETKRTGFPNLSIFISLLFKLSRINKIFIYETMEKLITTKMF